MYERILVPTDGSETAERAAREAIEIAEVHGATVHAVHVADTNAVMWATSDDEVSIDPEPLLDGLREQGREHTDAVAALGEERGVEVVTAVREGSPARGIVAYAEDNDVDLIVMGTRGRQGLDRVFGSTAERVVRRAPVPVLTLRDGEREE